MNKEDVLIIGCLRNGEKYIHSSLAKIKKAFSRFQNIHFLIIESDSIDETKKTLESIKLDIQTLDYISLGSLEKNIPLRTERMAYCRNIAHKIALEDVRYLTCSYIVVVDFDVVDMLSESGVNSCWNESNSWSVVTANQSGPYYDIWALRHPIWQPNDCWEQYEFLKAFNQLGADFSAVYSKMIQIKEENPWIEVESAFGGLAIYKRQAFSVGSYVGINPNNAHFHICEHVSFHEKIRKQGHKIFINPRLVNTSYTDHTMHMKPIKKTLYL